jgi:hypothetical protein
MNAAPVFALLAAATSPLPAGEQFAQLTIQQRVVIRVPMVPIAQDPIRSLRWVEKKGPKCIASNTLAGAVVTAPRAIDLVTRGGPRLRAQLDGSCQDVDLRFGFYIRPNSDGKICSDRDAIHARTGGQCEIEKFRTLVPQR